MEDWREFTGKTVDEALTEAMLIFETTSDKIDYEVIEKENSGVLGMFKKDAKIRAKVKRSVESDAKIFLKKVFNVMEIDAKIEVMYDEENGTVDIQVIGDDMGVLIGKRGQTLDALQYLVSLVINKERETYLKVKLDTENYRERRKETLENLAKNISFKVKKTHKPVLLEPMNPYERRIIHSSLQNDKFVETHSEGEEPYRHVVISMKKGVHTFNNNNNNNRNNNNRGNNRYGQNQQGTKKYNTKEFHKKFGGNTGDYSKDYKKDYAAYLEEKKAAKAAAENTNTND